VVVVGALRKTRSDLGRQLCGISGSSRLGSLALAQSLFEDLPRPVHVMDYQRTLGCRSTARECDAVKEGDALPDGVNLNSVS
jgi:hypothetical protein